MDANEYYARKDRLVWDALVAYGEREGVRVREKDNALAMKLAYYSAFMFIWNKDFMQRYLVAGFGTVYVPRKFWATQGGWQGLAHEFVHHRDHQRTGKVWAVLEYGFPQIIAVLGLLGFLGLAYWPLWFLFLLVPLFLIPIFPAMGRIERELRAYAMSLAVLDISLRDFGHGEVDLRPVARDYVNVLLGNGYFWPGLLLSKKYKEEMAGRLHAAFKALTPENDPILAEVVKALVEARKL